MQGSAWRLSGEDGAFSHKPTLATPLEMCSEPQGLGSGLTFGSTTAAPCCCQWAARRAGCVHPRGIAEHITQYKLGIVFILKLDGKGDCAPIGKMVPLVGIVVLELWLSLHKLTIIEAQPVGVYSCILELSEVCVEVTCTVFLFKFFPVFPLFVEYLQSLWLGVDGFCLEENLSRSNFLLEPGVPPLWIALTGCGSHSCRVKFPVEEQTVLPAERSQICFTNCYWNSHSLFLDCRNAEPNINSGGRSPPLIIVRLRNAFLKFFFILCKYMPALPFLIYW